MQWPEKGHRLACFWRSKENSVRKQQAQQGKASQELRVTTTQAGAVPSLTRDTAPGTQTGKEEQVRWQKPGSATVPNQQRSPTVTRQVRGLARKASQQVRLSKRHGRAHAELQHSSRDKMWRHSLNAVPEQEEGTRGMRLLMALPQPSHSCFHSNLIQGCSSTTAGLALSTGSPASPWRGHGALVPGNPKALSSVGEKKVYSSIEQHVATMRKQNDSENQMSEVSIKNNPGVQTYYAMHDTEIYVGSVS